MTTITSITKLYEFTKSWFTNPRGSLDSKRKGKIYKDNGGGGGGGAATSGSFGGGTVFTSTNSGIFSPTYGGNGKGRKKKKKRTGIERLGLFVTNRSPERKMVTKSDDFTPLTLELVKWVGEALLKDETTFRQQTSGEGINPQTKVIEDKHPVEPKSIKQKIRNLDDDEDIETKFRPEREDAEQTAPVGVEIQLRYGSGPEQGPLVTGGFRDNERGELEETEEDDKEGPFV